MRKSKQEDCIEKKVWSWSLNLENYDRCHELKPAESSALEYWLHHNGQGFGIISDASAKALKRLVQPITDTIATLDFPSPYDGRMALQLMLVEMHRRQTSLWAWSSADWQETIGRNHQEFRLRFNKEQGRQHLLAIAYVLLEFKDFWGLRFEKYSLATKIFGRDHVNLEIERVLTALKEQGYESYGEGLHQYRAVTCEALLSNRSAYLEDLTEESLDVARKQNKSKSHRQSFIALSVALERLGILNRLIHRLNLEKRAPGSRGAMEGVAPEWSELCTRWFNTSTLGFETRSGYFYRLLVAGRWLLKNHPEVTHPNQWTRSLAAEYVGAVNQMLVGQYSEPSRRETVGKPISAWTKSNCLAAMRTFFYSCQEWEWLDETFNSQSAFETPKSITALLQPRARQIDDAIWAKLLTAGLSLSADDLASSNTCGERPHWYPTEMIRALSVVWLFCALRKDDIRRLKVGCVRWTEADEVKDEVKTDGDEAPIPDPEGKICLLDMLPGKNGQALTKAVDAIVGKAIQAWETIRPQQAPFTDRRTGEQVHYLFAYRSQCLGDPYLNKTLIPFLCNKAGVPEEDIRGKITSHRARHTILTQLSESMTIPELQSWSGHKSTDSLMHYLQATLSKQAKAYQKTDYFKRNLRTFEVLIDREAVISGGAARGEPWKCHKLGDDGYCVYDFFDQCLHKMTCPCCPFYRPNNIVLQKLQENKASLQKMLLEIELTEDERLVVEEGVQAFNELCEKLVDVETPGGLTPRQLGKIP